MRSPQRFFFFSYHSKVSELCTCKYVECTNILGIGMPFCVTRGYHYQEKGLVQEHSACVPGGSLAIFPRRSTDFLRWREKLSFSILPRGSIGTRFCINNGISLESTQRPCLVHDSGKRIRRLVRFVPLYLSYSVANMMSSRVWLSRTVVSTQKTRG